MDDATPPRHFETPVPKNRQRIALILVGEKKKAGDSLGNHRLINCSCLNIGYLHRLGLAGCRLAMNVGAKPLAAVQIPQHYLGQHMNRLAVGCPFQLLLT
jgi:hypothetical protein